MYLCMSSQKQLDRLVYDKVFYIIEVAFTCKNNMRRSKLISNIVDLFFVLQTMKINVKSSKYTRTKKKNNSKFYLLETLYR